MTSYIKKFNPYALSDETLKAIAKRPAAFPRVAATSAEKGTGMPELRAEIVQAAFQ